MEGAAGRAFRGQIGLQPRWRRRPAIKVSARRRADHVLMKVETHNHPTAISPFPGASTGAGGEIRDEGATGRGSKPKAGLTGFTVSKLWGGWSDAAGGKPEHIASPLQIMTEGPLGGAAFNNEFGRPNLLGYFREYEQTVGGAALRGYHKPIMIAGGVGIIDARPDEEDRVPGRHAADPARRPGHAHRHGRQRGQFHGHRRQCGRSSTSTRCSAATPRSSAARRRSSTSAGRRATDNPILAIHDVGAGGLSNAFPELTNDAGRGARFDLRAVPLEESGLAPKEIWCNESQERYVMAIAPESLRTVPGLLRARALPVCGGWCGDRRAPAGAGRDERPGRQPGRHADERAAGQAAQDAPRRDRPSRTRVQADGPDRRGPAEQP